MTTLYVSDLDFTLLRIDSTLSSRTVQVVNQMVAQGHLFTYATARSYTSASRVTKGLRLRLPLITYGGAVVVGPRDGAIAEVIPLPAEAAEAIMAVRSAINGVEPLLFATVDGRDRLCWREGRENRFTQPFLAARSGDPRLRPLADWSSLGPTSVFFATFIGDVQDIDAMRLELSSQLDDCFVTVGPDAYNPEHSWMEITSVHATKAATARRLKQKYGAEKMVAFGDNLNDLPLLEEADHACAVANAVPDLLAIADDVLETNERDGVAEWLARHVL